MSNITMTLGDDVIKKVKRIALEKNTTLTGLVRDYLTGIAKREDQRVEEAIAELTKIMNSSNIEVGEITWTRDDLHER
ncbi:MAG: CopG family transcriptional regulator [Spirochaetes bacterium]|nr:MAG: CopG family transcriptional regulator [Spirochaetota bacterium]